LLRSLYLVLVFFAIFGIGLGVPFVLTLGYVWTDIFRPQSVAWFLMPQIPVALVMGAAAIGAYLLLDRRSPPRVGAVTVLTLGLALWVTLTGIWAEVPVAAWEKWDWAVKSILFSAFIPFVIRSRNQIEAFLQVCVFALAANLIPYGAKTILTGGGYGYDFGLLRGNSLLGEGGTLATAALLTIPPILFLRNHSKIVPLNRLTRFGYLALVIFALATVIGTHERTGLVGILVLGAFVWVQSKRKILVGALCAAGATVIIMSASASWFERMGTIQNYQQDTSAQTRLLVWEWTFNYALDHPLGGGFDAYRINTIVHPATPETGEARVEMARAFHSSYFEVLGEHGWVGLALFLALIAATLRELRRVIRQCADEPNLVWCSDCASALKTSLFVLIACGAFIGIAFQPFYFYLFALSVSLREYVRRSSIESSPPVVSEFGERLPVLGLAKSI
jgi:putative inorganic carbon (hco3(-)) transporter